MILFIMNYRGIYEVFSTMEFYFYNYNGHNICSRKILLISSALFKGIKSPLFKYADLRITYSTK